MNITIIIIVTVIVIAMYLYLNSQGKYMRIKSNRRNRRNQHAQYCLKPNKKPSDKLMKPSTGIRTMPSFPAHTMALFPITTEPIGRSYTPISITPE